MIFALKIKPSLFCLLIGVFCSTRLFAGVPSLYTPVKSLSADELAVIVNDDDPLSLQIANYYQKKRKIPANQVLHIRFSPHQDTLTKHDFEKLKQQVDEQTPKHVQAYLITWLQPFRVEVHVDHYRLRCRFRSGILRERLPANPQQPLLRFRNR